VVMVARAAMVMVVGAMVGATGRCFRPKLSVLRVLLSLLHTRKAHYNGNALSQVTCWVSRCLHVFFSSSPPLSSQSLSFSTHHQTGWSHVAGAAWPKGSAVICLICIGEKLAAVYRLEV